MGYIRRRQGKKGTGYQAHWTDDLGREQMKTFAKIGAAKDHITSMEAAKLKGEYVNTASKITVSSTPTNGWSIAAIATRPPYAFGL